MSINASNSTETPIMNPYDAYLEAAMRRAMRKPRCRTYFPPKNEGQSGMSPQDSIETRFLQCQ